ncbi:MAG: DUF2997 domain-containing protein [Nitrosopumilus sp.]
MRCQKQIIINIDLNGDCSIEGEGFVGPECAHFLNEIKETLGTQTSQRDKPEYRQKRSINNRNRQIGGR